MRSVFKSSVRVIAVTVGILAASVAPAMAEGEYEGETECRGNIVRQVGVTDPQGRTQASLELYYSRSEDLFCAKMLHVGPTYDVQLPTSVELYRSDSRAGAETLVRRDSGDYRRYAGPIGARGNCMNARGTIRTKSSYSTLRFQDRVCR